MERPCVLIVDDERNFREFLGEALESEGYRVVSASTRRAALAAARSQPPQVVLLDQALPDGPGVEILPELHALPSRPVTIVMTAFAEYSAAVHAVKSGAFHYLPKPFDFTELLQVLSDACVLSAPTPNEPRPLAAIVGESPQIEDLKRQIRRIARSRLSTVLIEGDSGTGKELVARAIHALSERAERRLVCVNCAALTDTLLMSELFGHERGAFTDARQQRKGVFEVADGGTLFLDEIGEMGLRAQTALLRVLEQRTISRVGGTDEIPVDVRIVAATNRDLEEAVAAGTFRADLYYRLHVLPIRVPPLRERGGDVLVLARYFSELFARTLGEPTRSFSPEASARLATYSWPGNVRELRNAIERAYVISNGPTIELADLPDAVREQRPTLKLGPADAHRMVSFQEARRRAIEAFERDYITAALAAAGGNITRAAENAGMIRQVFQRLMSRHGIQAASFRKTENWGRAGVDPISGTHCSSPGQ